VVVQALGSEPRDRGRAGHRAGQGMTTREPA
jgi:hypothetical protein